MGVPRQFRPSLSVPNWVRSSEILEFDTLRPHPYAASHPTADVPTIKKRIVDSKDSKMVAELGQSFRQAANDQAARAAMRAFSFLSPACDGPADEKVMP